MKTRHFARGFVGALSLMGAIGAVGCGAQGYEEGAAGEGEIGESAQALVADSTSIPTQRIGAGSCVIRDTRANPDIDLLVVAGGHDLAGNELDTIDVFRLGTGWTTLSSIDVNDKLSVARSNLKGIQIPGISNECLFVGGDVSGTPSNASNRLKFDLSTGLFSVTTQNLNTARTSFPISQCASDKVIVFGGGDNSVEIYDPAAASSAGAWSKPANTLVDLSAGGTGAPFSAALTNQAGTVVGTNASTTFLNFAIAGGFNGSNAVGSVDLLKLPSSCVVDASNHIKATRNAVTLATARQLAIAFPEDPASNDDVLVSGGDSSSLLTTPLSSTEILNVDFTTTFASATKSAGTAMPAVTRAPVRARLGTGAFYAIGGEDNSGAGSTEKTLATVYSYNPAGAGSWSTESLNDGASANVQERSAHVAEFLPLASKIYSTAGHRMTAGIATEAAILTTQEIN